MFEERIEKCRQVCDNMAKMAANYSMEIVGFSAMGTFPVPRPVFMNRRQIAERVYKGGQVSSYSDNIWYHREHEQDLKNHTRLQEWLSMKDA